MTERDDTLPAVTLVFLVHDRREELRTSLREMLERADYPADRLDAIVVDNASGDGSAEMVAEEFPQVRVLRREVNAGVSAFNDGFAAATGEYVLALDDDCYLPGDGLRRAVEAAERHAADLVSFTVTAAADPSYRFTRHEYDTGVLSFWGCSALFRRDAIRALGGYDPTIFVWANELELMLRFFDRGYRHLHLPEIESVHMKPPPHARPDYFTSPAYPLNMGNIAYVAARHLHARDAVEALVGMLAAMVRDGYLIAPTARRAMPAVLRGFARGLRRRTPVRNPRVSRVFRLNFHEFTSPWWWSEPPFAMAVALAIHLTYGGWLRVRRALWPRHRDRRERYFAERARYYPERATVLQLAGDQARPEPVR